MKIYLFLKKEHLSLKAALEELEISVEYEELIVGNQVPKVYVMVMVFPGKCWFVESIKNLNVTNKTTRSVFSKRRRY